MEGQAGMTELELELLGKVKALEQELAYVKGNLSNAVNNMGQNKAKYANADRSIKFYMAEAKKYKELADSAKEAVNSAGGIWNESGPVRIFPPDTDELASRLERERERAERLAIENECLKTRLATVSKLASDISSVCL